jgi:hypothetical protein
MLLATSVATRLEPPTGRAAERNAAQRYGAHERERWRAAALARQAEDIGRRGARGLREGAASRASPTIRKVPPSRVKTVKRAFGSGWQHTLGNNPVEPVLRRFRYRHAV